MFYKNLCIYEFIKQFAWEINWLNEKAKEQEFAEISSGQQMMAIGFVPIDEDQPLLNSTNGGQLIGFRVRFDQKQIENSEVNRKLAEKVKAISESENRPCNRREKETIKQDIIHGMLPNAPVKTKVVRGYIDKENQIIAVEASSSSTAEDVLALWRTTLGTLPVRPINGDNALSIAMTEWLRTGETSHEDIEIGDMAELRAPTTAGAVATFKRLDLQSQEVLESIEAGKQATKLALNFENVSFTLQDDYRLTAIKPGDLESYEYVDDLVGQINADLFLMAKWVSSLIERLPIQRSEQEVSHDE